MARVDIDSGANAVNVGASNGDTSPGVETIHEVFTKQKSWASDINGMTTELYSAVSTNAGDIATVAGDLSTLGTTVSGLSGQVSALEAASTLRYNYVRFGSGGVADRLSLSSPALSDTTHLRAIFKVKFIVGAPTPTTEEVLMHIGAGSSTTLFKLWRNVSDNKLYFMCGHANPLGASAYALPSVTETYTFLVSYDGDWWEGTGVSGAGGKTQCFIYNSAGVLVDYFCANGIPPDTLALSTATEISIGAACSSFTGSSNLFAQCAIGEVRLWATTGDNAIHIRGPFYTGGKNVGATVPAGSNVLTGMSYDYVRMRIGVVLTFSIGAGGVDTLTVTDFTPTTITLSGPITDAFTTGSIIGWYADVGEHVAEAISATPSATGILAGRTPLIYFGGTQLSSDWNIGNNRGSLAPLLMGGSVD